MSESLPSLAHCRGLTDPQAPRPVLRPAAYRQWPPGLPWRHRTSSSQLLNILVAKNNPRG
ncbi:hypothetical protein ACRRTK_018289 [Alexandromys fortis]